MWKSLRCWLPKFPDYHFYNLLSSNRLINFIIKHYVSERLSLIILHLSEQLLHIIPYFVSNSLQWLLRLPKFQLFDNLLHQLVLNGILVTSALQIFYYLFSSSLYQLICEFLNLEPVLLPPVRGVAHYNSLSEVLLGEWLLEDVLSKLRIQQSPVYLQRLVLELLHNLLHALVLSSILLHRHLKQKRLEQKFELQTCLSGHYWSGIIVKAMTEKY